MAPVTFRMGREPGVCSIGERDAQLFAKELTRGEPSEAQNRFAERVQSIAAADEAPDEPLELFDADLDEILAIISELAPSPIPLGLIRLRNTASEEKALRGITTPY